MLPNDAEKNQKAWELIIHEQGAGTARNPERKVVKGSGWENCRPGRKESAHLGKMTKGKVAKTEPKKMRSRSLEGRRTKGQLSRVILEWNVSKRLLGKKQKKEKKREEK